MSPTYVQLRTWVPSPQTSNGFWPIQAALPVDGEKATRRRLHAVVLVIRLERHLGHQLRPAIHVVRVEGRANHVLGEIQLLADVLLDEVRIDAPRRGEHKFVDTLLVRRLDQHAVEREVLGAGGLVKVDVAPTPMDRRQMEDRIHPAHHVLRHPRRQQVGSMELHQAPVQVRLDVLQVAAAQVIDHPDPGGAIGRQRVDEMRADERSATRDKNSPILPIHLLTLCLKYFPISYGTNSPRALR